MNCLFFFLISFIPFLSAFILFTYLFFTGQTQKAYGILPTLIIGFGVVVILGIFLIKYGNYVSLYTNSMFKKGIKCINIEN